MLQDKSVALFSVFRNFSFLAHSFRLLVGRGVQGLSSDNAPSRRRARFTAECWKTSDPVVFTADGLDSNSSEQSPKKWIETYLRGENGPADFSGRFMTQGTNALRDFCLGPGTASERRHLEEMASELSPQSLVVTNAGLIGDERAVLRLNTAVSFLLQVRGNVTLLAERWETELFREGQTTRLWPSQLLTVHIMLSKFDSRLLIAAGR